MNGIGESTCWIHTNKVSTRRAHSLVIEACERNVSVKHPEKGEVTSVEEGHDVEL